MAMTTRPLPKKYSKSEIAYIQRAAGLTPDGIVGRQTLPALKAYEAGKRRKMDKATVIKDPGKIVGQKVYLDDGTLIGYVQSAEMEMSGPSFPKVTFVVGGFVSSGVGEILKAPPVVEPEIKPDDCEEYSIADFIEE